MLKWTMILLLSLFIGTASAHQTEKEKSVDSEAIAPEDLKIVAELETLQLMELAENFDMLQDMNLPVKDDQNESQTK